MTPQKRELDFILECLIKMPIPVHTCSHAIDPYRTLSWGERIVTCEAQITRGSGGIPPPPLQEIVWIFTFSETDSKAIFESNLLLTLKKNLDI